MNWLKEEKLTLKLIKKKLKIKRLTLLNNDKIIIFTQIGLIKPKIENLFYKEILINNFQSIKISSKYIKNFINNELLKLVGLTNFNIYISKKTLNKINMLNLFQLFSKKFNIFFGLNIFNKFLTLKTYEFFKSFNLSLKLMLYIFICRIINIISFLHFNVKMK